MSRRGNVFRLPVMPALTGKLQSYEQDMKALQDHLATMTIILNQGLQSTYNRVNTIQQVAAKAPVAVTGLAVTGKQGLFHLVWNRIAHVDGYVLSQASDSAMSQLIGSYNLPYSETCRYSISVGNVAVTNSFQVYAYQGNKMGDPSPIVTATSLTYTTPEGAPGAPPFSPRQPKIVPPRSGPNI